VVNPRSRRLDTACLTLDHGNANQTRFVGFRFVPNHSIDSKKLNPRPMKEVHRITKLRASESIVIEFDETATSRDP